MKHTPLAFSLLLGLCLHCASQRPHVPWTETSRQPTSYDLNKDGIPDVFSMHEKDNPFSEESVDWNGDGTPEVHRYFEHGQLFLETYDLDFEGKPSLWLHYHQGRLVLKEWDDDGDGEADGHEFLLQHSVLDFFKLVPRLFTLETNASTPPLPLCCQTL